MADPASKFVETTLVKSRIRVGLIGCGWISQLAHIPNLKSNPLAEVVALSDPKDVPRAWAMRVFPRATAYANAHDLIADPEVDAVVIAVPPVSAASLAIAAFGSGKHVYLEKPGAASAAEGEAILSEWRRSGMVGVVGYNFRRHLAVADAYRRVWAGEIGQIVSMMGRFTWSGEEEAGWRAHPRSGGVLLDLASHHLDLARWMLGAEVETVQASRRSIAHPNDTADLLIEFAGGANLTVHVSSAEGWNANRISLLGRTGHIDIDLTQPHACRVERGDPPRSRLGRLRNKLHQFEPSSLVASGAERSFALLLDEFLNACFDGNGIAPDLEDALGVLEIIEKVHQTTQRGIAGSHHV